MPPIPPTAPAGGSPRPSAGRPAPGGPDPCGPDPLGPDPRAWLTAPAETGRAAGFGAYLHVPFCHHRCGYCDFATASVGTRPAPDQAALFRRYVAALTSDLGRQVAAGPRHHAPPDPTGELPDTWPPVSSVFVGGGTPTILGGPLLAAVVAAVGRELDLAPDAEITVECNPETASVELFGALVDAGVTRVSMGAQSFAPHVLATLERGHDPDRPLAAVAQAREAGVRQVSLDLIYGTPGESDGDWRRTLDTAVAAGVDHVSAYALTIHDSTPFARAVASGALPPVDEDVQRDRFDLARERLTSAGFEHYEVSNWARRPAGATAALPAPTRSRHNLLYWRHGHYLGVGVGAHGHLAGRRWWTTRSTERYLDAVEAGADPIAGSEVLDDVERAEERLLLGLRLADGIHPRDLPPIDPAALEDAVRLGLVAIACGRLACTPDGWFLLDEAVARLAPQA